jgi:hypothetical protein
MISEQFERLILAGKAEHVIFNVGEGIVNYNLGRGKSAVIESIKVQPMQNTFGGSGNSGSRFRTLYENTGIISINCYDNKISKTLSVKNSFNPVIDARETTLNTYGLSNLREKFDLFWLFEGENICIEISDILNSIIATQSTNPTQPNIGTRRRINPNGYSGNVQSAVQYTAGSFNWGVNLFGRGAGINEGGATFNDFVIPKNGDGITGNSIKRGSGIDANINQPIINIGIIEFNPEDLKF